MYICISLLESMSISGCNAVVIDAVLQESVVQGRPFQIPYLGIIAAEETCSQEIQTKKTYIEQLFCFATIHSIITTIIFLCSDTRADFLST